MIDFIVSYIKYYLNIYRIIIAIFSGLAIFGIGAWELLSIYYVISGRVSEYILNNIERVGGYILFGSPFIVNNFFFIKERYKNKSKIFRAFMNVILYSLITLIIAITIEVVGY